MKIFLRYIINSMKEKIFRELLLILAISLSTGLLFGALGWANSFSKSLIKTYTSYYEGKELYIVPTNKESFFYLSDFNEKGLKNLVPEIKFNSTENTTNPKKIINILSRDAKYNTCLHVLKGEMPDQDKNEVLISLRTSKDQNLNIGDCFTFYVNGQKKEFKVVGICENDGAFSQDTKVEFTAITSYEYMSNLLNEKGKYNFVTANKTYVDTATSIKEFNDNNKNFEAKELYSRDDINSLIEKTVNSYYIMLVFVALISIFIVQGVKKLEIIERMQVIGTFLSQGASKSDIKKILYTESFLEGIIGGIFGIIIGYGFLYFINYTNSPLKEYGIYEKLNVDLYIILIPIVFAVLMSLVACFFPIKKISKLQVKEVILNVATMNESAKGRFFIAGATCLIVSLVFTILNNNLAIQVSIGTFVLSLIGLMLVFPSLVQWLSSLVLKILNRRGKILILAVNNVKTSKLLLSNIRLMIIALISIMAIMTISSSVQSGVTGIDTDLNYDVMINDIGTNNVISQKKFPLDKLKLDILKSKDVDADSIMMDYSVNGKLNNGSYWIYGIDVDKYKGFNKYLNLTSKDNATVYENFKNNSGNKIIISNEVSRKLNRKAGDTVTLKINDIEKKYMIAGTINTKMFNMGNGVFVAYQQIRDVFHIDNPTGIYLKGKTSDNEKLKNDLIDDLKSYGVNVLTKQELIEADIAQTSVLIDNLKYFGYICMFICMLGVLNNITISFIQRKREFAVISSIGMSSGQRASLLLLESVFSSLWACAISIPYMFMGVVLCSKITRLVGFGLDVNINVNSLWMYILMAVAISVIATISVLFRNKKLTIINEIRFE